MADDTTNPKDPEVLKWEREKARWDAEKVRQEVERKNSPSAQLAEEAKNLQAVAESEQKAAQSRTSQIAALIPDLTDVDKSVLQVGADGPAIGSGGMTFGGLRKAAEKIGGLLDLDDSNKWRILVTSDPDLATPDSQFLEVTLGFEELTILSSVVLERTKLEYLDYVEEEPTREEDGRGRRNIVSTGLKATGAESFVAGPITAAIGAVASALPAVISLLSAKRSVSTGVVTVSDIAATAEVAGEIERRWKSLVEVVHDEFRLIPRGRIHRESLNLNRRRIDLLSRKIAVSELKSRNDMQLTKAKQDLEDLEKNIDNNDRPVENPDGKREGLLNIITIHTQKYSRAIDFLSQIDGALAIVDAFNQAIHNVPAGAKRSPIATAALYEQLHGDEDSEPVSLESKSSSDPPSVKRESAPRFTHVLLVKSQPGQWTQLTNDRPLLLKDKFATLVETNVTFVLISVPGSTLVKAGTASVTVSVLGELGSTIQFKTVTSDVPSRGKSFLR